MMTVGPRYALYFVPHPDTVLYHFGAKVLGCDCYTGRDVDHGPDLAMSRSEWADLTREPRTYGFHATLKAPFHLRADYGEADLVGAFRTFAAIPQPALQVTPSIQILQHFAAVVPRQASPDVDAFANACVSTFDHFRAQMTSEERARRLRQSFSERQIANVDRWGYPYVFDDFRFHMTLTGPIPLHRRPAVLSFLRARFSARHGETPVSIDRIALVRQDNPNARFRVISHCGMPATTRKF
jgi:putative phosphonate metabolism protein